MTTRRQTRLRAAATAAVKDDGSEKHDILSPPEESASIPNEKASSASSASAFSASAADVMDQRNNTRDDKNRHIPLKNQTTAETDDPSETTDSTKDLLLSNKSTPNERLDTTTRAKQLNDLGNKLKTVDGAGRQKSPKMPQVSLDKGMGSSSTLTAQAEPETVKTSGTKGAESAMECAPRTKPEQTPTLGGALPQLSGTELKSEQQEKAEKMTSESGTESAIVSETETKQETKSGLGDTESSRQLSETLAKTEKLSAETEAPQQQVRPRYPQTETEKKSKTQLESKPAAKPVKACTHKPRAEEPQVTPAENKAVVNSDALRGNPPPPISEPALAQTKTESLSSIVPKPGPSQIPNAITSREGTVATKCGVNKPTPNTTAPKAIPLSTEQTTGAAEKSTVKPAQGAKTPLQALRKAVPAPVSVPVPVPAPMPAAHIPKGTARFAPPTAKPVPTPLTSAQHKMIASKLPPTSEAKPAPFALPVPITRPGVVPIPIPVVTTAAQKPIPQQTMSPTTLISPNSQATSPRPGLNRKNSKRKMQKNRVALAKAAVGSPRGSNIDKSAPLASQPARLPIYDEEPSRVYNPLVDLPSIDPTEPPNSADLHTCSGIVYSRPDTFPLSYYARLLGFQVPEVPKDKYSRLDPKMLQPRKDIPEIPQLGPKLPSLQKLDYHDPVYKALLQDTAEAVSDLKRASINQTQKRSLHPECLKQAREHMGSDLPDFFLWDSGDFGVASSDGHFIRYQFVWYQFQEADAKHDNKSQSLYGMPSMAHHAARKKTAELILDVVAIGRSKAIVESRKKATLQPTGKTDADSRVGAVIAVPNAQAQDDPKSSDGNLSSITNSNAQHEANEGKDKIEDTEKTSELPQNGMGSSMQRASEEEKSMPDEKVVLVLMALVLEHARECDVFYGIVNTSKEISRVLQLNFRMSPMKSGAADNSDGGSGLSRLLCDMKSSSSLLAFLVHRSTKKSNLPPLGASQEESKRRMVVKLPAYDETRVALRKLATPKRPLRTATPITSITSCPAVRRQTSIHVRLQDDDLKVLGDASVSAPEELIGDGPRWQVVRTFPLRCSEMRGNDGGSGDADEIFSTLGDKIKELVCLEEAIVPKLQTCLDRLIDERTLFEKDVNKRKAEKELMKDYELALERRKELDAAWQKQIDQDMNAVCAICKDGEVTPGNQILFCEACNVAVHQMCYGIENVPEGDYYCVACRYFGRQKMSFGGAGKGDRASQIIVTPPQLPINCELCSQKQGAFIRCQTGDLTPASAGTTSSGAKSKWVHVVCAKWQGLNFVDKAKREVVENVLPLKINFRQHKVKCDLCQSNRGAFNKCRASNCQRWFHVTCARAYGRCEVVHGENCEGPVAENPWTLLCPEHSNISAEDVPSGSSTKEQLEACARALPPEVLPELNQKPNRSFVKMNAAERRRFLSERRNEESLVAEILERRLQGVRCEVCNTLEEEGRNLTKCSSCFAVYCDSCRLPADNEFDSKAYLCKACEFRSEMKQKGESFEDPQCSLCFQKGGWLRTASAKPMKKWASNSKSFLRTMFAKKLWAHTLCAMWQFPLVLTNESTLGVDLSNVIMTHGMGFVQEKSRCVLCGKKQGLKMKCTARGCRAKGEKCKPPMMHLTCARQAGLEVNNNTLDSGEIDFYARCYKHVSCEFAFRARLEDLIEMERRRAGKKLEYDARPMSISHASRLLNGAISILHVLGWSWRWADWWVEYGSTWEPLIEPGEDESKMTKEQLKIVDSTPESRRDDARKCRLVAFGAALRNRNYDRVENGDTAVLDRALRAVLNTKSLVGPLEEYEVNFFAQWLGMAYRSKSRLLGFGKDKISVDEAYLVHEDDGSPKFKLGRRRLPGLQTLARGQVFETDVNEIDDFLKPEKIHEGVPPSVQKNREEEEEEEEMTAKVMEQTSAVSKQGSGDTDGKLIVQRAAADTEAGPERKKKKAMKIGTMDAILDAYKNEEIIEECGETDVIMSLRGTIRVNKGTLFFREICHKLAASRGSVHENAAVVWDMIRAQHPPGRFLRRLETGGPYMKEEKRSVLAIVARSLGDRRRHKLAQQRALEKAASLGGRGDDKVVHRDVKSGNAHGVETGRPAQKEVKVVNAGDTKRGKSTEVASGPLSVKQAGSTGGVKVKVKVETESEPPRRRGRPPKKRPVVDAAPAAKRPGVEMPQIPRKPLAGSAKVSVPSEAKRRGPGRPPKSAVLDKKVKGKDGVVKSEDPAAQVPKKKKKRGRPPKVSTEAASSTRDETVQPQGKRRRSAPVRDGMITLGDDLDGGDGSANGKGGGGRDEPSNRSDAGVGVGARGRLKRKSAPTSFRDEFSFSGDDSTVGEEGSKSSNMMRRRERPKSQKKSFGTHRFGKTTTTGESAAPRPSTISVETQQAAVPAKPGGIKGEGEAGEMKTKSKGDGDVQAALCKKAAAAEGASSAALGDGRLDKKVDEEDDQPISALIKSKKAAVVSGSNDKAPSNGSTGFPN